MNTDLLRSRVLVTGGSGFIGRYLVDALMQRGADVTILSRHPSPAGMKCKTVAGDLTRPETLDDVCCGFRVVFHLAGDAHAIDRLANDNERLGWRTTVEGTSALVDQAITAGVSRFLFFSSVKAMGEGCEACLDEMTESQPVTAYGKAKHEAEQLVLEANRQGLSSTVLRLPMVYGPGCKGNLPRMIQAVARGRFPPLPETGNKRSMVDVRDVVQAALLAATNPVAAGKMYIVTDGQVYSTRQIYEWMCDALQRLVPRWVMPFSLLRMVARVGTAIQSVTGRRFLLDTDALDKLTGSAWYSSEKISRELNYRPAYTLKDSLPEMVAELRRNG